MASRGPAQSAGRNQKRHGRGGAPVRDLALGAEKCTAVVCCPPPAPARPASRLGLFPRGAPGLNPPRWGLGAVSLQRCHCPVRSRLLPSPAPLPQAPGNPCLRVHSRSGDGEGWGWQAWGRPRDGRNAGGSETGRGVASHRTRARCGPNKERSETERLAAVPFPGLDLRSVESLPGAAQAAALRRNSLQPRASAA